MRCSWLAAIGALLTTSTASSAFATEAVSLSFPELVATADRIEIARVEGQTARRVGGGAIVTVVTLRVLQSLKGDVRPGQTVQVLREGGEVAGLGMRIEGAAQFVLGEEVVVFLERRAGSTWTVGMAQGKMHIDTSNGKKTVTRDLRGIDFVGPEGPQPGPPLDAPTPLPALIDAIATISKPRTTGEK